MIELKKSPVVFNAEDHTYHLGEKLLNGVTSTLIHRAFPDKYKDIDPEVLARAAEKGHKLHEDIEFYDQFGGDPAESADERLALYANLKEEQGLTTIANEYLVSDEKRYASSIDIVMQDKDGNIILVDIKTTWNLDRQSTGLQLSIYKRFFERQNPQFKVARICALWLPNKDHTVCEFRDLSVVADETIDALIKADIDDEPFHFELIPDEWVELESKYAIYSERKEYYERLLQETKERMIDVMQQTDTATVKTDRFTVSYIEAKKSKRFDSVTFKKNEPGIYESYMKEVEMPAQLRVTPKKPKN